MNRGKRGESSLQMTKRLVFSAMAIALAVATSYIKIPPVLFPIPLTMGGSVTLFSMLFIVLIGYWYGPVNGMVVGVTYGILQMILEPYIISIPQAVLDYVLAFGALGCSGFFRNMKYGLRIGYIVAVFGRFVFSTLSGVIFFSEYAGTMNPWIYSIAYQGGYLGTECLMTLVLLSIPAVNRALKEIGRQAG